jgi:nicotinamidase-related amidase
MRLTKQDSIGLIIDMQEKLFPHMLNQELLEENIQKLLRGLDVMDIPVLVTQQYTKGLGETLETVTGNIADFKYTEKKSFSCCKAGDFVRQLKDYDRTYVIVAGIESHVCVLQTVLDLKVMGFVPVVLEDCVSSRNQNDKEIAVARMRSEGAIISTVESVLFELCQTAEAEEFKTISKIVK